MVLACLLTDVTREEVGIACGHYPGLSDFVVGQEGVYVVKKVLIGGIYVFEKMKIDEDQSL